jgi:diadenosine tetraphosphate (Ap4A) HIT family hydrolase
MESLDFLSNSIFSPFFLTIIGDIFSLAKEIIAEKKLNSRNFRIITNGGSFQDSKHLHSHLVSGDAF